MHPVGIKTTSTTGNQYSRTASLTAAQMENPIMLFEFDLMYASSEPKLKQRPQIYDDIRPKKDSLGFAACCISATSFREESLSVAVRLKPGDEGRENSHIIL
jgi:hypothetical protein